MKKQYIKVSLIEVDEQGNEVEIESNIRRDSINKKTVSKVVEQRKRNSGLSNISFTKVITDYAIFDYLSNY